MTNKTSLEWKGTVNNLIAEVVNNTRISNDQMATVRIIRDKLPTLLKKEQQRRDEEIIFVIEQNQSIEDAIGNNSGVSALQRLKDGLIHSSQ